MELLQATLDKAWEGVWGVLLTDGVLLSLENTSIITFISLQVQKQQHSI